jgi:hypothetical protein
MITTQAEPKFCVGDEVKLPNGQVCPVAEIEFDSVLGFRYCVVLFGTDDEPDERDWYGEKRLKLA